MSGTVRIRGKPTVDVLVVGVSTTFGHSRATAELLEALRELGVTTATAEPEFGRLGALRLAYPLIDFVEAATVSTAVAAKMRTVNPGAIVYPTSHAALLEPRERLRSAAIRFDATTVENRPGWRNSGQHLLERRSLKAARMLLPWSLRHRSPIPGDTIATIRRLPTPVEPAAEVLYERTPTVLCYAGDPEKKGLDLMIRAWALLDAPGEQRLVVAGISAESGRAFLRRRRIAEPRAVTWAGVLSPGEFRTLSATTGIYLSASRIEEYGIAQLEALADGALLVTAPSTGAYEAHHIARALDPALVGESLSPEALRDALQRALNMSHQRRVDYQSRARDALLPYSRTAFRERLAAEVLPRLLR